jgi:hypothetical protein
MFLFRAWACVLMLAPACGYTVSGDTSTIAEHLVSRSVCIACITLGATSIVGGAIACWQAGYAPRRATRVNLLRKKMS